MEKSIKHTKYQRHMMAQVFEAAIDKVDHFTYICHAIEFGVRGYWAEMAAREVRSRMNDEYTLENWIAKYGNTGYSHEDLVTSAGARMMRQYRKRWLKALAEEFAR